MSTSVARALSLLRDGAIEVLGIMPGASNYTFAVSVDDGDLKALAVYKPRAGETPLWDFPEGTLHLREVAAYVLSESLAWGIVPPTILREGPHGIGSLQLFIDATPNEHAFTMPPRHAEALRLVCAFDLLANNADRKAGHCLQEDATGRLFAIDHGVCFHVEDKLRTVLWDFAGEPLPDAVAASVRALLDRFPSEALAPLLEQDEVQALRGRCADLLARGIFPQPPEDRRAYPWPPV